MPTIQLDPMFAAFAFETADASRSAFRALRDSDRIKGVSVWAMTTPERDAFVVAILGERERAHQVNSAAEAVMEQPGCLGNYLLSAEMMETLANRRYGTLAREFLKDPSNRQVRQEATYGSGVPINRDGTLQERKDG